MKKIPVTEQNKQMKSVSADSNPSSVARGADAAQGEAEDPIAGLQGDLDRFRDLALRSQADFENYKKRSAREKEEAAVREAALEAERKAARDARYAARKKRK